MSNHVQDVCGHKLAYLEDKCPGVQLLGHMISVCSLFKETAEHFSKMVVLFYIPTSVRELQLYNFTNTWYYCTSNFSHSNRFW